MPPPRGPLVSLAVLALWIAVCAAQQPTFRAGVELVHVDVVVLNKVTGQPVHDLQAKDFTLVDRKKAQEIATFSAVDYDHDPAAPAFPPDLPLDVADNSTAKSTRIVAIVVDDLHVAEALTDTTKEIIRHLLRDLGPQATVGLTFTSGNGGVEPTDDRAQVYKEIDRFKGRQRFIGPGASAMPNSGSNPMRRLPDVTTVSPASATDFEACAPSELQSFAYAQTNALHRTLEEVARVIGAEASRRKALVLVSEGLNADITGLFDGMQERPRPPCPNTRGDSGTPYTEDDLLNMMDMMRRANVATYAINPETAGTVSEAQLAIADAVASADVPQSQVGNGLPDNFAWNRPSVRQRDYLSLLSSASGGFAIVDPGTLNAGLATLLNDLDHYYMLGFYPAKKDGAWHDLDVTVDRDDVVVRFRRGYREGAAPQLPKNKKEPLAAFAASVLPVTDLPLKMFATPLPSAGSKTTTMAITMQLRADREALVDPDGTMRDTLHMLTMAVDLDRNKLTPTSIKRERFVTLTPMPDAIVGDEITYQIVSKWELPPGRFQLRTTVQSQKLGKSGSVYLNVDVPDFNRAPVALSGLVIGFADPKHRAVDGTAIEHDVLPLEPVLDRVFAASDTLRVFYDVWRKNPRDSVSTSLDLLDEHFKYVRSAAQAVPEKATGHVDVLVPLDGLAPGAYVLRISAVNNGASDRREVGFVIK